MAGFKGEAQVCSVEGERKDHHAAKNPYAPADQQRSRGDLLVSSNLFKKADGNRFGYLTPVHIALPFCVYCSTRSPRSASLLGPDPNRFNIHVAILDGRLEVMLSLL